MPARYFIPKSLELSQTVIDQLIARFFLLNMNVVDIMYWNDKHSPYGGTIIYPEGPHLCYPYDKGEEEFLLEFSEGEIWKPQ